MGVNVSNVGHGTDFSTGEKYIEFHRRINLSKKDYDIVVSLLSKNEIENARTKLLEVAPKNSLKTIDLFLDDLKVIQGIK